MESFAIIAGIIFITLASYLLALVFISTVGGWKSLSKIYPFNEQEVSPKAEPIKISGLTLYMGTIGKYTNSICILEYEEGIRIRPYLFYRFYHEPIFIKWSDIVEVDYDCDSIRRALKIQISERELKFYGWDYEKLETILKNRPE